MTDTESPRYRQAFGRGADARIAGLPVSACPLAEGSVLAWIDGWNHANRCWGLDAKWPVAELPAVGERSVAIEDRAS